MKSKLISYFECLKHGDTKDIDVFLSKDEKNAVQNWYQIHINKYGNMNSALQFMYELYIAENIDVYEITEFQKAITSWSEIYGFNVKEFCSILKEYRRFIYE